MGIVPCGGESAEIAPLQNGIADSFQARAHDDQTCGDDTDILFDYGDGQGGNIRP